MHELAPAGAKLPGGHSSQAEASKFGMKPIVQDWHPLPDPSARICPAGHCRHLWSPKLAKVPAPHAMQLVASKGTDCVEQYLQVPSSGVKMFDGGHKFTQGRASPSVPADPPRVSVEFNPSWPQKPDPQHFTPPPIARAQVCVKPSWMSKIGPSIPVSTTVARLAFVTDAVASLPRRPLTPQPQHFTAALAPLIVHEWSPPVSKRKISSGPTLTAGKASPISAEVAPTAATVVPYPSCPLELAPKHFISSVDSTTHVPPASKDIPVAVSGCPPLVVPRSTGGRLSPIVNEAAPRVNSSPVPRRPLRPYPQHFNRRLLKMAQVCANGVCCGKLIASVTAVKLEPKSMADRFTPIWPGWFPRVSVSSYPSCPCTLRPQHFISPPSSSTQLEEPAATTCSTRPPTSTYGKFEPNRSMLVPRFAVSP
mmetsp:Transcript_35094/g.64082  ORF Transcript_35094/g.64082 Transcript_35094/m.64082 type:complete len:423 (-) Transcript_35094:541-1809(-)